MKRKLPLGKLQSIRELRNWNSGKSESKFKNKFAEVRADIEHVFKTTENELRQLCDSG